ncbi:Hypothetical_protein [Hexamita inflata]|uniref:Hypothetical_protein n=1 Tax=Hexamita inflata TaxID=28002 RepID=A0ABP1J612_9EUKA
MTGRVRLRFVLASFLRCFRLRQNIQEAPNSKQNSVRDGRSYFVPGWSSAVNDVIYYLFNLSQMTLALNLGENSYQSKILQQIYYYTISYNSGFMRYFQLTIRQYINIEIQLLGHGTNYQQNSLRKDFEIVLVALQSYRCGFVIIEVNNKYIYLQNTKYQFNSKVEQLGSISRYLYFNIYIPNCAASYAHEFGLVQIQYLQIDRIRCISLTCVRLRFVLASFLRCFRLHQNIQEAPNLKQNSVRDGRSYFVLSWEQS